MSHFRKGSAYLGYFEGDVPEGGVPCPPPAAASDTWGGAGWVPAPASANEVKAEAGRRILKVMSEWKQRNLIAQATQLAAKGRENWTPEEQAAWDAGKAKWDHIALIRTASDLIEADTPISADFADDPRWPT